MIPPKFKSFTLYDVFKVLVSLILFVLSLVEHAHQVVIELKNETLLDARQSTACLTHNDLESNLQAKSKGFMLLGISVLLFLSYS